MNKKQQIYFLLECIHKIKLRYFNMVSKAPYWIEWRQIGENKWEGTPRDGLFPIILEV